MAQPFSAYRAVRFDPPTGSPGSILPLRRRSDRSGRPSNLRDSGIDLIGGTTWGTHFCQFYQTREDMLDVLVPYFKAGLECNEFCMWITCEPLDSGQAEEALREAMPDLDRYMERGQLEIMAYSDWYLRGGVFDSDRVLAGWIEKLDGAKAKGFEGLRLTGNTFWLEESDWDDFTDYEAAINRVIGDHEMIALCTYCLDRCSAHEIVDVVKNHQFALINRQGRWEVIQSDERKRLSGALRASEARAWRRNVVLDGINRVLLEALTCQDEEALGQTCLQVAQEVTGSAFGFIGELNADGLLDDIAISDSGWDECKMGPQGSERVRPSGLRVHGLYGKVLKEGKGFYTNDPPSHPDSIGTPSGHSSLSSFLGVPLVHMGRTIGMIAMANRPEGYDDEDMESLELLAPAVVQAFMRRRAETERERLLEEVKRQAAEAESHKQRLSRLVQLSEGVLAQKDMDGLLGQVIDAARELTGARMGVSGHGYREGHFEVGAASRAEDCPDRSPGASFDVHRGGVYLDLIYGPNTIRLTDEELRSHPSWWGLPEGHGPLRGMLGARLMNSRGEGTGLIMVSDKEEGDFTEEDEALLSQLAAIASLGLQHIQARGDVEAAVRVRDEFMSVAAHELKTPVTSLRGFSQLLVRQHQKTGTLDPARVADAAARIDEQSRRLTSLTDQLLDVSRIEAGRLVLSRREIEITSLVNSIVESIRQAHPERTFEVRSDGRHMAELDGLRIEQVLVNLLDNASKFSPVDSPIEVEVAQSGPDELSVSVRDRGFGIPEEKRGRVFERFFQAHVGGHYGGMGIGLYVSRQIVELHGGSISVEAPKDGGSRFVVRLPLHD